MKQKADIKGPEATLLLGGVSNLDISLFKSARIFDHALVYFETHRPFGRRISTMAFLVTRAVKYHGLKPPNWSAFEK
jgi:hypothetical protein